MSGAAASLAERLTFAGWLAFAGVNCGVMFVAPGAETVPFHLVWISLAVVYGFQPWSLRRTALVLTAVCTVTGLALVRNVRAEVIGWEETTEVPLMCLVFLASVWHVRRRIAAERTALIGAENERRMKDALHRFVRFASHELRTPLTVARGYTELIRVEHVNPQVEEDAAVVLDELDKLGRIAARLLELVHVEDQFSCRPADLDELLHRAVRRWRLAADRRWLLHPHAGWAQVDAERLAVALDCLLDNAVKYTEAGSTIELRGSRDEAAVTIEIADDGSGIDDAELPYVFEAFHSGPRGGSGLGLAMVHSTMLAHHGSVTIVESSRQGTVFRLRLPLQQPAPLTGSLPIGPGATDRTGTSS